MLRPLAAAGLASLALTLLPATAQAATAVTVTSPTCGTLKITNNSSTQYTVMFDSADIIDVPAGTSRSLTGMLGGSYSWVHGTTTDGPVAGVGVVNVTACSGVGKRPVEGDDTGDGLADVLGIQANTGDLYFYRMTSTTLYWGVKVGTGWNSTVFAQRVYELEGSGTGNYLVAVRSDGTVWRYQITGAGKFGTGVKMGSIGTGYDNFTITQANNPFSFGGHSLFARKGSELVYWDLSKAGMDGPYSVAPGWSTTVRTIAMRDFNNDNAGDFLTLRNDGTMWFYKVDDRATATELFLPPVQKGFGWGAMQTVASPGSLNGDRLSDLIARRSDGNLYKYINAGGRWNAAQQIGVSWQLIRMLV